MEKTIRILHLEDDPYDAESIQIKLESMEMAFQIVHAWDGKEFEKLIEDEGFDLILADYKLPGYDGMRALQFARKLYPDIPFIIVSGTMGEDAAIECLTRGATDYVLKVKMSRLAPAIKRALNEAENLRERKRVEEALIESGERFRAVADSANEGMILADSRGQIIYWNKAAFDIFGYSETDVFGKSITILMPQNQQEQLLLERKPNYRADLPRQTGKVIETIGKRKSGIEFPLELSATSWKSHDAIYYSAIIRDISERKQHESEREAIISVAKAMRFTSTREELVMTFLNQIIDVFKADGSMLVMRHLDNRGLVVDMGCGEVGKRYQGLEIPEGEGISNRVIIEGLPYLNDEAASDPAFFRPDLLGDSHAVACIPLFVKEKVIGAFWMARKKVITESDVNLLKAIANLAASAIHRISLYEQTERHLYQMASLHQIDLAISSITDLKTILDVLLSNAIKLLGVDAASILIINPQTDILEYGAGVGFNTNIIEKSSLRVGEGRAGAAASEKRIFTYPDLNQSQERFDRINLTGEEGFLSHHVAPLVAKGQVKGVLEVFSRKRLDPGVEWIDFFGSLATLAAIAIDTATLFNELQTSNIELTAAYDATIRGWSQAMDMRDKETEGHTQRVAEMAVHLAELLGLCGSQLVNVRRGALLHDIGKMGVPDHILLKPNDLTEQEWDIMRRHPTFAYEMLAPISFLKAAIDIPYCHHEKWDGSGYPRGLCGSQIPLSARIFAIVDVWDAIISDRPYRKAWTKETALAYIQAQSGKYFEPSIVDVFVRDIATQDQ